MDFRCVYIFDMRIVAVISSHVDAHRTYRTRRLPVVFGRNETWCSRLNYYNNDLSMRKLRHSRKYYNPLWPLFSLVVAWLKGVTVKLIFKLLNVDQILTPFWPYIGPWNFKSDFGEISSVISKMDRSRRIFNRFCISRALRDALVECFRMAHSTAPLPKFFTRVVEHLSKWS